MLAAHYDSVPSGLGAGDDSSGVVTLLEAGRALRVSRPFKNNIIFLSFLSPTVKDYPQCECARQLLNIIRRA
jgi:Peptidase family M28